MYNVGQVIAGEVVSHEFTVTNPSPEALSIVANQDVIKNCGCTELTPAARTLPPGGSTTVKVAVNTTRKDGPLDYGGSITWTAASGAKRTTQFVLRGRAVSALVCDPPMVRFEDADLRAGTTQELKFLGNVSVDWATARVSSSSPLVQVLGWKRFAEGATCRVRCSLPPGQESLQATVAVRATVVRPGLPLDKQPAVLSVLVLAHQRVALVVTPQVVPIAWSASGDRATARLMLRGDLLLQDKRPIEQVECPGFAVTWSLSKPSKAGVAILQVNLVPTDSRLTGAAPTLTIRVKSMKPIALPVSMVRLSG